MADRTPKMEVFRNAAPTAAGFCWRLRAGNGEIVADGSESYTRRSDAVKAAERAKALMADAAVEVIA